VKRGSDGALVNLLMYHPRGGLYRMKLCCYSNLSFLQAEEEERILLPINHIITKKQCKGKGRATIVAMLSVHEEM
jgi:hypothetical protein